MRRDDFITRGMRIRFQVFQAQPIGTFSIAGVQPKLNVASFSGEGVVTDVRGDHPTHPTKIGVWVRTDDGTVHGPIPPKGVLAIIRHGDDSD